MVLLEKKRTATQILLLLWAFLFVPLAFVNAQSMGSDPRQQLNRKNNQSTDNFLPSDSLTGDSLADDGLQNSDDISAPGLDYGPGTTNLQSSPQNLKRGRQDNLNSNPGNQKQSKDFQQGRKNNQNFKSDSFNSQNRLNQQNRFNQMNGKTLQKNLEGKEDKSDDPEKTREDFEKNDALNGFDQPLNTEDFYLDPDSVREILEDKAKKPPPLPKPENNFRNAWGEKAPSDLSDPKTLNPSSAEEVSNIERVFMGKFPELISRDIKQFGYDLFNREPDSFTPMIDIPVGPDYVIGPRDVFTIHVWGSVNLSRPVRVSGDGTITLPRVGTLKVGGLKYHQLTALIQRKFADYFSGVRTSVTFDNMRMIDVFVVGSVKQPGSYSVPSTATVINALFYAGGPSKEGSLRDVRLIRNNKEIARADLYDFLISGASSKLELHSQDVILVPVIGPVAGIAGSVKRPGIYELKKDSSIYDLLQMAGGLSFTGSTGILTLQRVEANKRRVTRNFNIPDNFRNMSREAAMKTDLASHLEDGDLAEIFPVPPTFEKTVYLRGYVKRPGPYEFKPGMTVHSILSSFDQLLPDPYLQYVQIVRTVPPKDEKKALFTNLGKVLAGDKSADLPLQAKDEIIVFSKDELNLRDKVMIEGKVNKPGVYYFFDGMSLKDLILMAGNITQEAYLSNAEIARYTVDPQELKFKRIPVDLSKGLDVAADLKLEPRDRVTIQGLPHWEFENFIRFTGEVRYPGNYSFGPKERLSSVIERAGGFTEKSFLPGAVFTRLSVKKIQEQSLKEQISRLEEAVLDESARGSALSGEDAKNNEEALTARKSLLRNLQSSEVTGRMVIRLDELKRFKNSKFDITLEPGDTLTIPPTPSVVTIAGEVFNPTSVVYDSGKSIQYYIDQCGGMTSNADAESVLLIKADGTVISKRQNRGFLLKSFYQTSVDRGDTILVPKDISRFSWLATTKDITGILFQIASTTGITITAFK